MTASLNLDRRNQLTLILVFVRIIKVIRGRLVYTSLLYEKQFASRTGIRVLILSKENDEIYQKWLQSSRLWSLKVIEKQSYFL